MVKRNNLDYLKELDTQIEITKGKIEYAKQNKDFIYMEDMNSLLKTLVNAKDVIEYYTKDERKTHKIFKNANKSVNIKKENNNNLNIIKDFFTSKRNIMR